MEILEVIREKVSDIAAGAVKIANKGAESIKGNWNIISTDAEISKMLKELGGTVYSAYKESDSFPADEVAEFCAKIDEKYEEITAQKAKLQEIKNTKTCDACQASVKADFKFCPKCGKEF